MSIHDQRGAPMSNGNAAATEGLEKAFALFQGYFNDPLAEIDTALAADPGFFMGHAFRAGLFLISSEKAAVPELAASVAQMERLAPRANERERGHLAAARSWLDGDFHGAIRHYGETIANCPRDAIALQFAHQVDFLLGQSRMLRDRIAPILPHWTRDEPTWGYLKGMHAFGLEEMGHYDEAWDAGSEALAINPRDAWAVHACAHVCEMTGRTDQGIAFLESRSDDWAPGNGFAFHNWWHLALYHFERGDIARVLELYDTAVHPEPTEVAMALVDAAALLWRLHLAGHDVGNRWQAVADAYEPMVEDGYYAFNDMHAVMAFAATGREVSMRRVLATMERRALDDDANAVITRRVGLPICRAMAAFGRGDFARTVELLEPVRLSAHQFGGSHAQRDILDWTLIEAALRSGQNGWARAFANERLARKPQSPLALGFLARATQGKAALAA